MKLIHFTLPIIAAAHLSIATASASPLTRIMSENNITELPIIKVHGGKHKHTHCHKRKRKFVCHSHVHRRHKHHF